MNISSATKIHLVGAKGVGMAAVACCLSDLGKTLTGSDSPDVQITDPLLASRNIPIHDFAATNITPDTNLVIYSGAYKLHQHPELLRAGELAIPIITQAQAAAELSTDHRLIAVCGVGGKTTTTAMLIHVFESTHHRSSWLVGVSSVCNTLPPGRIGSGDTFIAEADEYAIAPPDNNNPKFSLYHPEVIICTNLKYDHPDIYPDFAATKAAFLKFFQTLPVGGLLVYNADDPELVSLVKQLPAHITRESFGTYPVSDWFITHQPDKSQVTLTHDSRSYSFALSTLGLHNARNAAAAAAVANHFRIQGTDISTSLTSFTGTKRRLELVANQADTLYFDDYAHHPSEIQSVLEALHHTYPHRRLIAIFQPHTFSRTKALLADFATAFACASEVIITPIFSSTREQSDTSISSEILVQEIGKHHPHVIYSKDFANVATHLKNNRTKGDLIITLGAGDIYQLHSKL